MFSVFKSTGPKANEVKFTLIMIQKDRVLRCTGEKAEFRLVAVDCTQAANHIADLHQAKGLARQLLGESIAAALLHASGLKGPGTVQLRFQLSGDISRIAVDATPMGLVRAMIPSEEIKRLGSFEPMNLPQTLTVRKLDQAGKRISDGIVEMLSSDISTSLRHYLTQSEQSRSWLQVYAHSHSQGSLKFAGGFILEAFPKLTPADWTTLEKQAESQRLEDFSLDEGGFDIQRFVFALVMPFSTQIHREIMVTPFCPCSEKGVLLALKGLEPSEIEKLILEEHVAELHCDFCRKQYLVQPEQLCQLLDDLPSTDQD